MKYILALDQGTTSSRAVLMSEEGLMIGAVQKEFKQIFPQPGWVEHDPLDIWQSQSFCIESVLAKSNITSDQVAAIGITNQRETTVVWERKTGKPLMNALVWQDRRTTALCEEMKKKGLEPLIRQKTGLLLDPYFSATKLVWMLKAIPQGFEKAAAGELAFGTIDSWLLWKLSGGECHATDVTNASRTLLLNIHTLQWDEELLSIFKIPKEILPSVHPSSHLYGMTRHNLFSIHVPITGIAGDQQAALVGQACFEPAMVKSTYGTGCFMLMNTGSKPIFSKNNLITTVAYQIGKEIAYALEGSVFIGGAVVQWLRDNLKLIEKSADIEPLAASVPSSDSLFFVPAFTGLGAPYWDPYARGAIVGLTRGTTGAHIARSALESIAYQVTDVLKAMEADFGHQIGEIRVDGGAVRNPILMQFQADIMQTPVIRPVVTELTAQGAAYLAGLHIGIWKDFSQIKHLWKAERKFSPQMSTDKVYNLKQKWAKAVKCAQMWES